MSGEGIHDLLPWHVNGTLDEAEDARFTAHLGSCADCQEEMQTLRELRQEMRRHGEDFLEHPDSATIVGAARRELPAEESTRTLKHLALCVTCAAEARWVAEDLAARLATDAEAQRPSTRTAALAWGVAATLLVALVASHALRGLQPGTDGTTLHPYFLDTVVRSGGDEIALSIPPGEDAFLLYLLVEAAPHELPLTVELRDDRDRRVLLAREHGPLFRERFVFVYVTRRQLPDGRYEAEVRPSRGGETSLYRFRVETAR